MLNEAVGQKVAYMPGKEFFVEAQSIPNLINFINSISQLSYFLFGRG